MSHVSFSNIFTPVAKRRPMADDDEQDLKRKLKAIRREAQRLDDDADEDDEDEKKRKLKAYAKRLGVLLQDEDDDEEDRKAKAQHDEDERYDEDDDEEDRKRKALKAKLRAAGYTVDEDDDEDDRKRKSVDQHNASVLRAAGLKLKDDADDQDDDADDQDDEMDGDERKQRGVRSGKRKGKFAKVSFADVIFAGDVPHSATFFSNEDQPRARQPRLADDGRDPIGREYSGYASAAVAAYAGAGGLSISDVEDQMLPEAGAGTPWEGMSPDTPNSPFRPFRFGEGDRGRVGGEDRGVRPARPNLGRDGNYTMERDDIVPEGGSMVPARIGDGMRVMSPRASGIAPASGYRPSNPTVVLKITAGARVLKSRKGLFRSVLESPLHGFAPDGGLR